MDINIHCAGRHKAQTIKPSKYLENGRSTEWGKARLEEESKQARKKRKGMFEKTDEADLEMWHKGG